MVTRDDVEENTGEEKGEEELEKGERTEEKIERGTREGEVKEEERVRKRGWLVMKRIMIGNRIRTNARIVEGDAREGNTEGRLYTKINPLV